MSNTLASYSIGKLDVIILFEDSAIEPHPTVTIAAPHGYRIIGGGAKVQWEDPQPGALLTAMYPSSDGSTWTVASKDHSVSFPHVVTGYAICVTSKLLGHIPDQDYQVISDESDLTAHPVESVKLPDNFKVVGGGARANYHGAGQLLTASHPLGDSGWYAASKDHVVSDPSTLTVWAIGLSRGFLTSHGVLVTQPPPTASAVMAHPAITAPVPADSHLLGGGAHVEWHGAGNLLTGSYPVSSKVWAVAAKDHQVGDPSIIDCYLIAAK